MPRLPISVVVVGGLIVIASCGRVAPGPDQGTTSTTGVARTQLPGHITAGGLTSGAVMAVSASAPSRDMGPASRQAGTPGIPQGAGGNTSGTEMGGTTGTSALANTGEQTEVQSTPGQGAPPHAAEATPAAATAVRRSLPPSTADAAASAAATAAEQERLLDERMTLVAQRWQQRDRRQGGPGPASPAAASAAKP